MDMQTGLPDNTMPNQHRQIDIFDGAPDFGNKESEKTELEKTVEDLTLDEADSLGRRVMDEFTVARSARLLQEKIMLQCHRNYKGIYPAGMDFSGGTSRAFVQVTRPKVCNVHARMIEVVLPPGEDAWSVEESPRPFVPEIATKLLAANAPVEDIQKQMTIAAKAAANVMSSKIKDGLAETNWPTKLQESLLHMCVYGTMVIMGPRAVPAEEDVYSAGRGIDTSIKNRLVAAMRAAGSNFYQIEDKYRPEVEVVSPFEFYPSPGAKSVEDCQYAIVRKVFNRSQIIDLAKVEGFFGDKIQEVLTNQPTGYWTPEYWEADINLANDQPQNTMPHDRFVCLIRWGYLSGKDIAKSCPNLKISDDQLNEQLMCEIWTVAGKTISLRPSTIYRSRLPFYVVPYSLVPHSIWGAGPAEFMMDSQDGINACERAKYDNMALVSGPNLAVNVDRLAPGQDALDIRARRVWATQDSIINHGDPIKQIDFNCHIADIQKVQQDAMAFSDEQTNIPRNLMGMGGEGVHNRTLGGASLQFNNAIVPLKGVVFNVDTKLMTPMLRDFANFYLEYSDDETIKKKGDFQIIAKGVSGLMGREVAAQKVSQLVSVAAQNQDLSKRLDMQQIAEVIMKGSGMNDVSIVLTETEVQKRAEEAMHQQHIAQAAQAQLQSNIDVDAQTKLRAQTSVRDVRLQVFEGIPDSCVSLKIALAKQIMQAEQLLDMETAHAFDHESKMQQIRMQDEVHGMGTDQANRELGITAGDIHKMNHAKELAQLKQKPQGITNES